MVKTLFFLEDPKQFDRIIQDSEKISGDLIYISLSPYATYTFEKFNIPFKSIGDYSGAEDQYQQGLENFQRFDRIATILDKELVLLHNIPTLTPVRYSVVQIKTLLDVLWNVIHILKKIIDTEQPNFIHLYATPQEKSGDRINVFSNDESIYARILNMPGWNVPIKIIQETEQDIPYQRNMKPSNLMSSRLRAWIKRHDLLFNLGLIGKREGIGAVGAALFFFITCRHRKPVLIYNSGYNWDDSLVELYKAGMVPVYRIWDDKINKTISMDNNYGAEIRKVCNKHPDMREFDQILGIEISAFFFGKISQIIGKSIQESIAMYLLTRRIIHQKKIRCLLHSVRDCAIGHAIVQAAQDTGIPVVSWQHGGAGYCYHPMMPFIEFINSDWHFVFGEGVAESYSSTSKKIGLKKIPVFVPAGSSFLEKFWRLAKESPIPKANRSIVYITTTYLHNSYLVSQSSDLSAWDKRLWLIQKQFMDLTKKYPEKKFIIKLHPTHKDKEPLISYAKDQGIKNLQIITTEMNVRDLTDIADLMIFDLISTGILQVLTSNLPVFVYSGLHAIDEETLLHLKTRAYVSNKSCDFFSYIEEYIQTRRVSGYSIDIINNNFMLRYGTDIYLHNSAEMAVKKLKEIIH